MDMSSLINDYMDDANQHLSAFDSALMDMERDGFNKDTVLSILGTLHTFKGNSGMMGFESLKAYIHVIEELLKKVLEGETNIDLALDPLLDSANVIRNCLTGIEKESEPPDLAAEIMQIQSAIEGNGTTGDKKSLTLQSYLGTKTDTIKVDFQKLDTLLNLVGEMVIFKTRLFQIEERIREQLQDKSLHRELNESLQLVERTVSELQEGIMNARMLPVRVVFTRFTRMVRDIAKQSNKQVNFSFEGEDTELDKTVIDELGEPLLHLIKNAVDHGLETPEQRISAGKSPAGTIKLTAIQESNYIIIKVSDNGRGIDPEHVKEKALHQGLIHEDDALDRDFLLSLIFTPGFSTKDVATDESGRGIGLDVVSRNISRLNGQVTLESQLGRGSTFTIKLPLSLAIIPALMAEASGETFAIPMSAVDESVKVREEEIHIVNNKEVVRLRDRIMPVIRLGDFFNLKGERPNRFYLVVVGKAEKKIAIAVDKLRDQQEIVIKPLDETMGKSHGIAGASILGDGKIILIVDVMAFWDMGAATAPGLGANRGTEQDACLEKQTHATNKSHKGGI